MKKQNPINNPQSLAEAVALLTKAANAYNKNSGDQFDALIDVCAKLKVTKSIYKATAKPNRPKPTWEEFAASLGPQCGLRFESARMADNYIKLGNDIESRGVEVVKKTSSAGSFRDVRAAIIELTPDSELPASSPSALSHLRRALKWIEHAEEALPKDLLPRAGEVKRGIQGMLDAIKPAAKADSIAPSRAAKKVPTPPKALPGEWKKRLAEAFDKNDKVAVKNIQNEIWQLLESGKAVGFPPEVTFTTNGQNLREKAARFLAIRSYLEQCFADICRADEEKNQTTASVGKSSSENLPAASSDQAKPAAQALSVFKPSTVQQIADRLGSKTELGKAVGKEQGHAHYWTKMNQFPEEHRPKLIKTFLKMKITLDLELIKAKAA